MVVEAWLSILETTFALTFHRVAAWQMMRETLPWK
jgi:hypothetical protein